MTESSRPWQDGVGDGGPYSDEDWRLIMDTLGLAVGANVGVVPDILNELAVTSTGDNNITVNTGRAVVDGTVYENTTSNPLTSNDPGGAGTTGRRLVLQKNWAARTVRLVIITSADDVTTIPALTQVDGVTWEIPLASFQIAPSGAITALTDQREYTPTGAIPAGAFISRAALTRWTRPGWVVNAIGTRQLNADQIHLTPILIQEKRTFDRIGCEVTTGHGSDTRLGIYNARLDADGLVPTSLIVETAPIDVTGTGDKEGVISEELLPGWYFLAEVTESNTPAFRTPTLTGVNAPVTGRSATVGAVQSVVLATATDAGADYVLNGLPDPCVAVTILNDATFASVQLRDSS